MGAALRFARARHVIRGVTIDCSYCSSSRERFDRDVPIVRTQLRTLALAREIALTIPSLDFFDQDCVAIVLFDAFVLSVRKRSASSM
jgi:hypothetical protein